MPGYLIKTLLNFDHHRIHICILLIFQCYDKDSFVIYMILEGNLTLKWNGGSETAVKGETILIPACIEQVTLEGEGKLLEIYID